MTTFNNFNKGNSRDVTPVKDPEAFGFIHLTAEVGQGAVLPCEIKIEIQFPWQPK